MYYNAVDDYAKAPDKVDYVKVKGIDAFDFAEIAPDAKSNWLDQSDSGFEELLPLANRETKLAKTVTDEQAVFGLYSLGIVTARDEWTYDFQRATVSDKVYFFSKAYFDEMRRFEEEQPEVSEINNWVDRTIKWTAELENHLIKGSSLGFATERIVRSIYRPYITKYCYYAPIITHRRYQQPSIFPDDSLSENTVICYSGIASTKSFQVLATDQLPCYDVLEKTQCLPLYRYTPDGERVSNITQWGLRQFRDHYGDDDITDEDIFAYVYAMLHDPAYRQRYEIDLRREFPRVYFQDDFAWWADQGRTLLDLHINFETIEPYPLQRSDSPSISPSQPPSTARPDSPIRPYHPLVLSPHQPLVPTRSGVLDPFRFPNRSS